MPQKTKKEVNQAIGKRIETLRLKKNLTRHRLGLMIGASGGQVESWEEGASPNLYYVMLMCEVLETTPTYLLTGKVK